MHTFLLVVTYRYYRESLGVLIVYDITSRPSFEHVEGWLNNLIQQQYLRLNISAGPSEGIPIGGVNEVRGRVPSFPV